MYCFQTVKQVPASFTKKRLLLRIISTFDVILLAGLYGEGIREACWGYDVYSRYGLFFSATRPFPMSQSQRCVECWLVHSHSFAGLE